MRWTGLIALLIIIGGGVLVSTLFMDTWTEAIMEKTGEIIIGARVEFEGVDVDPAGLSITWTRLQVTDPERPMTNILETGTAEFNLNAGALLRKRINIETLRLEEFAPAHPGAGTAQSRGKRG